MTEAIPLRENERLDDLMRGGLRIFQRTDAFRFGTDAVLLSDFARVKKRARACDLGTGTGILPLLIYAREPSVRFDALEIQPDMADMAARSVALNGLENAIHVLAGDLNNIRALLPHAAYDLVVCNPPYGKMGATLLNPDDGKRASRHEGACDISDVARAAAWLLKNGGRFCCVFPAPRMLELLDAARRERLEPKTLRLVHSFCDKAPHLCLMEAALNANPGLYVRPPLIIYDQNRQYTPELRRIYGL